MAIRTMQWRQHGREKIKTTPLTAVAQSRKTNIYLGQFLFPRTCESIQFCTTILANLIILNIFG